MAQFVRIVICINAFLLQGLVLLAQNNNQDLKAGDIAPNAIKLEVDDMSIFFGGFAVIKKGPAQALINDKGEIVVPYNTYRFNEYSTPIGAAFYPTSYYGALVRNQNAVSPIKLISFVDIKTDNNGYITPNGKSVVQPKKTGRLFSETPGWLHKYDEEGYFNDYAYTGLFPNDGRLVSYKYDGSQITGKGNYLKIDNKGGHKRINYNLEGYTWVRSNNGIDGSVSGWTNGLRPASYVLDDAQNLKVLQEKDPVKIREHNNTRIGFINRKGEFQIKPNFYAVGEFSEGVAFVSKINEFNEQRWGAIDTTGKLIIPFTYRSMPSRFSFGRALIKAFDVDKVEYAFIDKKGEIVFTIPKNSGDTSSVTFTNISEYDFFHFSEGYQLVGISFKGDRTKHRYHTFLLDTNGHYTPIEQLLSEKLSGGGIGINLPIRDGKFIFKFSSNKLTAMGMADINGNILLEPNFIKLSLFEKESNLQYAQQGTSYTYSGMGVEGYIDRNGIFRIIKVKAKGGF